MVLGLLQSQSLLVHVKLLTAGGLMAHGNTSGVLSSGREGGREGFISVDNGRRGISPAGHITASSWVLSATVLIDVN